MPTYDISVRSNVGTQPRKGTHLKFVGETLSENYGQHILTNCHFYTIVRCPTTLYAFLATLSTHASCDVLYGCRRSSRSLVCLRSSSCRRDGAHVLVRFWIDIDGCGSLPGFHLGYLFLTHRQMDSTGLDWGYSVGPSMFPKGHMVLRTFLG